MIRGVAFDLEGTVVNVEPAHHGAWIRAAREIGVLLQSPEEAIEKVPNFIGGPDGDIVNQIFALLPEPVQPTREEMRIFLERKWAHYHRLVDEIDLRPRDGFLQVYGELQCAGIPMTIGTAVDVEKGIILLKRSGLARLFTLHEIVMLTDVKHPKPAPDCFLATASVMGIRPREQLVFEDSPRGVQSGVAAGSPVIGIPVYNHQISNGKLLQAGVKELHFFWKEIDSRDLLRRY